MFEAFGAHGIDGIPRPRHAGAGGLQLRVRVRQVRRHATIRVVHWGLIVCHEYVFVRIHRALDHQTTSSTVISIQYYRHRCPSGPRTADCGFRLIVKLFLDLSTNTMIPSRGDAKKKELKTHGGRRLRAGRLFFHSTLELDRDARCVCQVPNLQPRGRYALSGGLNTAERLVLRFWASILLNSDCVLYIA